MVQECTAPAELAETLRKAAALALTLSPSEIRDLLLHAADEIEDLQARASKWDQLVDAGSLDLE